MSHRYEAGSLEDHPHLDEGCMTCAWRLTIGDYTAVDDGPVLSEQEAEWEAEAAEEAAEAERAIQRAAESAQRALEDEARHGRERRGARIFSVVAAVVTILPLWVTPMFSIREAIGLTFIGGLCWAFGTVWAE